MARFEIPTKDTKLFIQSNKGDVFGNLFGTFNMDFDTLAGKVRVSRRTLITTDSTDDADLGLPIAFVRSSADTTDRWWAICGAVLFKTTDSAPGGAMTQDAIASTPTGLSAISSDMVDFNGSLIVSQSTDLNKLTAGTWTATWWTGAGNLNQAVLTSGIAHPLCVSLKTNLLLAGDGNLVHTVDKNNNVKNSRVILPSEFEVIWIRSTYDGTWIGARNKFNREAKAFFWDEYAENYNRGYGLKDEMTFSGCIKDGIPYTVNGLGQLLRYTDTGFEEVGVFPVFQQINKKLDDGVSVRTNIHRNGMAVIENKIHINICSLLNQDEVKSLENFPSGIWTFDDKQGLRHKYGLSLRRATGGSEIDYGAFLLFLAGALVPTENSAGLFLVGAAIRSSANVNIKAILYGDAGEQFNTRGHFITSIMESSAFEDDFKDLLLTFRRFRNTTDRIIVKYRSINNSTYPIISVTNTWTSTTTFTTTTAGFANVVAGDEIMILQGRGAGATVKISSITVLAGTYTITISEAILNASGTFQCMASDWTELATVSTQSIERQGFDLDVVGTYIQLKIELRCGSADTGGTGNPASPVLERVVINSQPEILT